MSQPTTSTYPTEFKEHAVTLAVNSDQPMAHTAHAMGIQETT